MAHRVDSEPGSLTATAPRAAQYAASIVVALSVNVQPARADAEPPPEVNDASLEEITVTAQRRAESAQRVPISISTLQGDELVAARIQNINALSAQVPNMQTTTPFGDAVPIFSLRGVSAVDFSQNQSSPVALYVDEVYKGLPVFTSLQVFDVERVEVLRGPQGTLYGKNTTGGAVNFYTRGARVDDGLSGYVDVGYGRLNRREVSAAVNVPLGATLATRLAVQAATVDGMVENKFPGADDQGGIDNWAARLSTAWTPTDSLAVSLRVAASESTPTGYGVIADNIGRAGPGGAAFGTEYTRAGLSFWENEADSTGALRIRNRSAALTVTWDASDTMTLTSVSSYDGGEWFTAEDADGTPFSLAQNEYISKARALSQEFRLGSKGDGPLTWLVGAYGYTDSVTADTKIGLFYDFSGFDADGVPLCFIDFFSGCTLHNRLRQDRQSMAAYGQASYRLTNRLSATAGVRYTDDSNELGYYTAGLGYFDPAARAEVLDVIPTIESAPVNQLDTRNWSGKLGLEFQVTDKSLLYASVSRGYRGGSFNGQAFFAPDEVTTAEPERLTSVEIGFKSQLADDRLRVNGAAFRYDYRNQQFIDVTPQLLQVLYNAPKSRIYGGEIEVTARPVRSLDLRAGVSYLNARYREALIQGRDVAGNEMQLAPEWTATAGLDWTILDADWGKFAAHVDSRYTSKTYYDPFQTEEIAQGGYFVHDAQLTLDLGSMPLRVSAWITNLTNEEYRVYRLNVSQSFNLDYGQRGRPREFGLSVRYEF